MRMQKDCRRPDPYISVSQKIAEEIRSERLSAFVPVTAADLIWLEVFAMDGDISEHCIEDTTVKMAPCKGA